MTSWSHVQVLTANAGNCSLICRYDPAKAPKERLSWIRVGPKSLLEMKGMNRGICWGRGAQNCDRIDLYFLPVLLIFP